MAGLLYLIIRSMVNGKKLLRLEDGMKHRYGMGQMLGHHRYVTCTCSVCGRAGHRCTGGWIHSSHNKREEPVLFHELVLEKNKKTKKQAQLVYLSTNVITTTQVEICSRGNKVVQLYYTRVCTLTKFV